MEAPQHEMLSGWSGAVLKMQPIVVFDPRWGLKGIEPAKAHVTSTYLQA